MQNIQKAKRKNPFAFFSFFAFCFLFSTKKRFFLQKQVPIYFKWQKVNCHEAKDFVASSDRFPKEPDITIHT